MPSLPSEPSISTLQVEEKEEEKKEENEEGGEFDVQSIARRIWVFFLHFERLCMFYISIDTLGQQGVV